MSAYDVNDPDDSWYDESGNRHAGEFWGEPNDPDDGDLEEDADERDRIERETENGDRWGDGKAAWDPEAAGWGAKSSAAQEYAMSRANQNRYGSRGKESRWTRHRRQTPKHGSTRTSTLRQRETLKAKRDLRKAPPKIKRGYKRKKKRLRKLLSW